MQVTEITVSAGRTFNHPYESYANFKPSCTVKASLAAGEDMEEAIRALQAKAEAIMEDHKNHVLKSLHELEQMTRAQQQAASLERKIKDCQSELDRLRENPGLAAIESTRSLKPVVTIDTWEPAHDEEDENEDDGERDYDRT